MFDFYKFELINYVLRRIDIFILIDNMYKIILIVYFFWIWNRYEMDMNWIWKNKLSVDIFESIGYKDEYLFFYLIKYQIKFKYKILNLNLKINNITFDPNLTHCGP